MAGEVNSRVTAQDPAQGGVDPRLFLRDEELDRGLALVLEGARTLKREAMRVARASGLAEDDCEALLAIRFSPGLDIKTLRQRMGATTPTFARLLARLDSRSLIARERSEADGRRRVLVLSEAGLALTDPIVEAMRETLRAAYREAGAGQVAGVRAVLEAMLP